MTIEEIQTASAVKVERIDPDPPAIGITRAVSQDMGLLKGVSI